MRRENKERGKRKRERVGRERERGRERVRDEGGGVRQTENEAWI